MTYVGGPPFASGAGSLRVRSIRIGRSGQGSSSARSSSKGSSGTFFPWLNQSWTSNWSQAPARTLTIVAGLNSSRVSSSRLTTLGFGSSSSGADSGYVPSTGTLRPKRAPIMPIAGCSRSV